MLKIPECFLCGRECHLDRHHIFGGANRKKSEQYGLVVLLCHDNCHLFGINAVHRNAETMKMLREYGQRKVMREQGWDIQRFIKEFGKNYITEE